MDVRLVSNNFVSFIKQSEFPALTSLQKKIILVVGAVFSLFLAYYVVKRCCLQPKLLNGPGKKTYPDGSVAEGAFKNGVLHGQGKRVTKDGTILEGEFKDGVLIKGSKTETSGRILAGEFQNGSLIKGKITNPKAKDSQALSIEGESKTTN